MQSPGSILHWIEANVTDPAEAREMHAVIHDEEARGLERMAFGAGFDVLIEALVSREGSLATGICTPQLERCPHGFR